MKNLTKIFLGLFILCCFSNNSFAFSGRSLTVFAEQNMVPAFVKLARIYSQKNHVIVSVNFNSSAELINEVDSGEPADIFISAHTDWIETLKQKGLTDVYNTGYVARDKLVLVTSKNNKNIPLELLQKNLTLEGALKILNRLKASLLTDQYGSSSGKYSADLIKFLDLDNLQLVTKIKEDETSASDLAEKSSSYALLLVSQIENKPNLQIIATQAEENIFYQAIVIAGDNMETAREFLKFLKSDTAKSVLQENGFLID